MRLFASLVVVVLSGSASVARAQQAETTWWVTNGNVRTSALYGDQLVIGGDFTYLGPPTGRAGFIDRGAGSVDLSGSRCLLRVSIGSRDGMTSPF